MAVLAATSATCARRRSTAVATEQETIRRARAMSATKARSRLRCFTISTNQSEITIDSCSQTVQVSFGNYCTIPSGGLTLGFWSNKNGQKILCGQTGSIVNTTLLGPVVTLLNSCSLRNKDGSIHVFDSSYANFRSWLLNATATNMAYMLSAQLATLKLDVNFLFVDSNAFDLCS